MAGRGTPARGRKKFVLGQSAITRTGEIASESRARRQPTSETDRPLPTSVTAIEQFIEQLGEVLPAEFREHLADCLTPSISSMLKPVVQRIKEMLRHESEPRPYSHKGTALRAMLTPNAVRHLSEDGGRSRFPRRISRAGRELLVRLSPAWHGKDYMIFNTRDRTFRAWPESFYRPRKARLSSPPDELQELLAESLPEMDSSTALIRLSLGPTVKIRACSWIDLGELPYRWPDLWSRNGLILPQAYVHSVIQHLGSLCGLAIAELDDGQLEVTWNSKVFAMREIIKPSDWVHESKTSEA